MRPRPSLVTLTAQRIFRLRAGLHGAPSSWLHLKQTQIFRVSLQGLEERRNADSEPHLRLPRLIKLEAVAELASERRASTIEWD